MIIVFAFGSNVSGQIGLGEKVKYVNKFTLVSSLSNYKIKSACAGYMHSLFITTYGLLLSCGRNSFGQLFVEDIDAKNVYYEPFETFMKKGVTFALTGPGISGALIDIDPPKNMPNIPLCEDDFRKDEDAFKKKNVPDEKGENAQLRQELCKLRREKNEHEIENQKLKEK